MGKTPQLIKNKINEKIIFFYKRSLEYVLVFIMILFRFYENNKSVIFTGSFIIQKIYFLVTFEGMNISLIKISQHYYCMFSWFLI